jgi:sialate O-acetylesterase
VLEDAKAIPADYDGTIWLRREVTLPEDVVGKDAKLTFGPFGDLDQTWVNGVVVGGQENNYSRTYPVSRKLLHPGANTIAVRLLNLAGKSRVGDVPSNFALVPAGGTAINLSGPWKVTTGIALAKAAPLPVRYDRERGPTALYNGMIAPLVPMTFTGAIWYQGEGNAGRANQYRTLLPAMIADWRGRFAQGDFPFGIVSLANFWARKDLPQESAWAVIREAQALTARSLPACGLALAIDLGEADNIHPKNKQDVGRRLALWAEATHYGRNQEWSGPWYTGMTVENASIRLRFDHLGGGLRSADGRPLTGFAIAGKNHVFTWAEATIDGDTVVVKAAKVANPVAVRYAWANNPDCNLTNQAGLPAVPFRTDDW